MLSTTPLLLLERLPSRQRASRATVSGPCGKQGSGDVEMDIHSSTLTTKGTLAHGIWGYHTGSGGNINIDAENGSVTTEGRSSYGITAWLTNPSAVGNIVINTRKPHY